MCLGHHHTPKAQLTVEGTDRDMTYKDPCSSPTQSKHSTASSDPAAGEGAPEAVRRGAEKGET